MTTIDFFQAPIKLVAPAAPRGEQAISHATREAFLLLLLADTKLPRTAKVAATVLLLKFLDIETGSCIPPCIAIAKAAGFTMKTTYAAVDDLERAGWVTIERGAGSHKRTHSYVFHFDRVIKPASPAARVLA